MASRTRLALAALMVLAALSAAAEGAFTETRLAYPRGVARPGPEVSYAERDVGAQVRRLAHGGAQRTYHRYAGPGAAPGATGPRPVVVLLHGAQRSGLSMIDMWRATADREGLVLLAPDAAGAGWDPRADGPDFLVAVLNDAARLGPLDPARVHLFGHSSGATLALLYANRAPGPWVSVGAHAGVLPPAAVAPAARPVPIRLWLGEADHLFPLDDARASARALADAGHAMDLVAIRGHTHWYYAIGPKVSDWAWDFFAASAPPPG